MAKKLLLDDGIIELDINGNGLLRFNPSDPNVYHRFCAFAKALPEIKRRYDIQSIPEITDGEDAVTAAAEKVLSVEKTIDAELKARLGEVFGRGNDFELLLGGVNLMSLGRNGEYVISNLLNALRPYMADGIQRYRQEAAASAKQERERRRAVK